MKSITGKRTFIICALMPAFLLCLWMRAAGAGTAEAATDEQREKLDNITEKVLTKINSAGADLQNAADALAKTGLTSPEAHRILLDLCAKHPATVDCSSLDVNGIMVAVEPAAYKKFEGSDVGTQDQIVKLHKTRKPVVSGIFKAVEGFYAIDMEWPVLSPKGELLGSASMIVRPVVALDRQILPELGHDASDVWVMTPDGKIIYSRYREDVGDNPLVTPSYVGGETLHELVKEIAAKPEGTGHFNSKPIGGLPPRLTRCVWKTVTVYDSQWRVVLFGDARED